MGVAEGKNLSGFTLLELLVVIALIGLLSALSMTAFNTARDSSKSKRCLADLKQIVTAINLKRDELNSTLLGVTGSNCTDCACRPFDQATLNSATCINRLKLTFSNLGFSDTLKDPWGIPYMMDENEKESGNCTLDSLRSLNCGSVYVPYYMCN